MGIWGKGQKCVLTISFRLVVFDNDMRRAVPRPQKVNVFFYFVIENMAHMRKKTMPALGSPSATSQICMPEHTSITGPVRQLLFANKGLQIYGDNITLHVHFLGTENGHADTVT